MDSGQIDKDAVTHWISELRSEDPARQDRAQFQIEALYIERLRARVQKELSDRLKQAVSAQDVANSALRAFFERPAERVVDRKSLWSQLAKIAVHKARNAADYYHAQKRNVRLTQTGAASQLEIGERRILERPEAVKRDYQRELDARNANREPEPGIDGDTLELFVMGATPEQAQCVIEMIEALPPQLQEIARMCLKNEDIYTMARQLEVSPRTIQRRQSEIIERLQGWGE